MVLNHRIRVKTMDVILISTLLIIASSLVHKLESVFIKKYNSKHSVGGFIFTAIVSLFSMLFFLITDIASDPTGLNFTGEIIIYGILAGACYALASLFTFIALGSGSFVLTGLILSYGIVITISHGLFRGEELSLFDWIGLIILLVSVYLVKGKKDGSGAKITPKWVYSIALSVLFAGAFGILQREQQFAFNRAYNNEFMIVSLAFSAVFLFTVGIVKDGKNLLYIMKNGSLFAAGAGLSNGATNLISLFLYSYAPISFISPMSTGIGILLSFIISKLIFKESFSQMQYAGVAAGAAALILFNI